MDYQWISLRLAKPSQPNLIHLAKEISANQIDHMLKREQVEPTFLGIIRLVKEESETDVPEESTTTQKLKWDQALPLPIREVLEEYDDVFPQDLLLGLPPE